MLPLWSREPTPSRENNASGRILPNGRFSGSMEELHGRTGNMMPGMVGPRNSVCSEGEYKVSDVAAIAEGIRRTRKEAGLTQEDLAHLAGTSERTVRAIETGSGNPSLQAVVAVANVLGLKLAVG